MRTRLMVVSAIGAMVLTTLAKPSLAGQFTGRLNSWPAIDALAFNPSLYFEDERQPRPLAYVDATQRPGRWEELVRWAFAIERGCPGMLSGWRETCRRLMIRVVSTRPTWNPYLAPNSPAREDLSPFLDANLDWREADIDACPGAMATLNALGAVRSGWKLDERGYIIAGAPADAVTVSAVSNGFATYTATEFEGEGETSAWAQRMLALVQPCLKPSNAPAPWDRHLLFPPIPSLTAPASPGRS